jgi:hypothetical protein
MGACQPAAPLPDEEAAGSEGEAAAETARKRWLTPEEWPSRSNQRRTKDWP